ncbi:unnamed protein product [Echinostoma caproni]|uniref:ANAPC4_WD40 domain-containing protein n=1 Tax=Echinostoma caproni TaxID=27848 RepID=A0A183AZV8_9TREM|nr:unnamed protein product [Echinostoma caproni]
MAYCLSNIEYADDMVLLFEDPAYKYLPMAGDFSYCAVQTKQISKHKISVCSWSPKTDLIALGSQTGCVSVHRYKMSCIWESAHADLGAVTCLAWRSDGQSLCASHASGTVHLYLTNDGFIYHTITLPTAVTHLSWIGHSLDSKSVPITNAISLFPDLNALTMFKSLVSHAQQLRTLSVHSSSVRVCKLLLDWSFSQICVSWEDMILEVDAKFTKYGRDRLAQNKVNATATIYGIRSTVP